MKTYYVPLHLHHHHHPCQLRRGWLFFLFFLLPSVDGLFEVVLSSPTLAVHNENDRISVISFYLKTKFVRKV